MKIFKSFCFSVLLFIGFPLTSYANMLILPGCSATAISPKVLITATHCPVKNTIVVYDKPYTFKVSKIIDDGSDNTIVIFEKPIFMKWAKINFNKPFNVTENIYYFGNVLNSGKVFRKGYTSFQLDSSVYYDVNGYYGDSGSCIYDQYNFCRAVISEMFITKDGHFKFLRSFNFKFKQKDLKEAGL